MADYRIKTIEHDDRLENVRLMDVTLGRKNFVTPFKTMKSRKSMHLYEIYQRADEKLMQHAREGSTILDRLPGACKGDSVNFIIPEYNDSKISDRDIRDLENRIHPNTDAVIVPRWDGILKNNNESTLPEKLWEATGRYIGEIIRMNGKLIMGNIPMNRPQSLIDMLIEKYFKSGVTSFVLDYESCQAPGKAHILRNITKRLVDDGFREQSLLYQINMKKSHNRMDIKPADDFLSFVNGVDILGNYYFPGGGGNPGIVKVFSPEDWAYFDSAIGNLNRKKIDEHNREMINMEAEKVKKEIRESGSVLGLARKKRGATEYIQSVDQTTLDFGGVEWA